MQEEHTQLREHREKGRGADHLAIDRLAGMLAVGVAEAAAEEMEAEVARLRKELHSEKQELMPRSPSTALII